MIPELSVLGDSTHERISPDDPMKNRAGTTRLQSWYSRFHPRKFRRHFRTPYEILELVQLAKHQKWFSLAAREVAWRQCLPVVLKGSQSCC